MFVVGRVLDPAGQAGAGRDGDGLRPAPSSRAVRACTSKGRPRLRSATPTPTAPAGSGSTRPAPRRREHDEFVAVALAPGYGVGWVELDPDADQPAAEISLQPEQVIQGRLFDLQGRPAQGVAVSVSSIRRVLVHGFDRVGRCGSVRRAPPTGGLASTTCRPGPSRRRPTPTAASPSTASAAASKLSSASIDPRFAPQTIEVETDDAPRRETRDDGAATGQDHHRPRDVCRHRQAGSARPAPGLRQRGRSTRVIGRRSFQTDADGRFRANPSPGDHFCRIGLVLPPGSPTSALARRVDWPKGAVEQSVDLALPRGVAIRGKVIEEGSDTSRRRRVGDLSSRIPGQARIDPALARSKR